MTVALAIILLSFAGALALGFSAGRGKARTLESWSVGGRGFGTLFMFLLMAGEIYTTFTFLGGSGWAYGKGAPAFYILCYGSLAYITSYWLLPAIWRYAKEQQIVTQAEFMARKYESAALGVLVAVVGVVAMIPYLVLQLKGLGIIVSEASNGAVSSTMAIWSGTIGLVAYVMVSGIHGSALTALVKDVMILVVVVALGLWLPWHLFGGLGPMFDAVEQAKPGFLVLPAKGLSASWFSSTVLLTALGLYMWPQNFASAFSARNADTLRRNATFMPLYQLVLLFVFFIGFAALVAVPGLEGANVDLSLLRVVKQTLPGWVVGTVGAAGVLTALVPGSMILMAAATVLADTVYRSVTGERDAQKIARIAKALVPVVAGIALWFTFRGGSTIVALLLMGYSFVTQLFPAAFCALIPLGASRRVSAGAVGAGICVGVGIVSWTTQTGVTFAQLAPSWPSQLTDVNIGILALGGNVLTLVLVELVRRVRA